MATKGNGKQQRPGGEQGASHTGGTGSQMPFTPQVRGLDGGLAKECPSTDGLTQRSYRSFRRKLELLERQCHQPFSDEEKTLMKTHGMKAVQVVSKLHRQLGHPSNEKLCKSFQKTPSSVTK